MANLNGFFEVEEPKKRKKILIFDFHNLVYRSIFVAGNEFRQRRIQTMVGENPVDFTKDDMYLYWKSLVLNGLLYAIKENQSDKVIIANESKNNWRKDFYSEYKATRKKAREDSPIDFDEFFPILNEFIIELKDLFKNVYFIQVDRCEGDDIIAVLTKKYGNNKEYEIELISTDKDFVQLQKFDNFKQFTPIKKEYLKSLNPKRDLEIKILTGDKSDNIPNVKYRCGVKTAEKMINEGLTELETDEDIRKNYIRNKKIIDFDLIPDDIQDSIIKEYENYDIQPLDGAKIWEWLDGKFPKLYEDWNIFFTVMKNLS